MLYKETQGRSVFPERRRPVWSRESGKDAPGREAQTAYDRERRLRSERTDRRFVSPHTQQRALRNAV